MIGSYTFTFPKLPKEILAIRDSNGLLPYTRKKLAGRKNNKNYFLFNKKKDNMLIFTFILQYRYLMSRRIPV